MEATRSASASQENGQQRWRFLAATLPVGSLSVRELRVVSRAFATSTEPSRSTSGAVPPDAMSVRAL